MAEYIDRTQLEPDTEWSEYEDYYISYSQTQIENMEPADVIERSKIDKAIEKLRKEIEENHLNVIDYADGEWIVKEFVYGAIERFKRNIGE